MQEDSERFVTVSGNGISFLALMKPKREGGDIYAFLYRDDRLPELLRLLGRYASHVELNFTWLDAARCQTAAYRLADKEAMR